MESYNSRRIDGAASPVSEHSANDIDISDIYGRNSDADLKDEPVAQKRSSWIDKMSNMMVYGKTTGEDGSNSDDDEEMKKEEKVIKTIKGIRNKMIALGLDGVISIEKGTGVFVSGIECEVTQEDNLNLEKEGEGGDKEISKIFSMTDSALRNLLKRAKKWEGIAFNENITLKRGYSISFESPFIKVLSFSFDVMLEISVQSLLVANAKKEENKAPRSALMSGLKLFSNGDTNGNSNSNNESNTNTNTNSSVFNMTSMSSMLGTKKAPTMKDK